MSRVAIDVIWSGAKPVAVVGYYTVFGLALSLYFLKQGKGGGLLIPLVVFLFPVTLLASQLNSAVPLFEHIKFALQVFIPCLFLVAVTNVPRLMYQTSVTYKKYFSFGAVFLLMAASYISYMQESLPGESYYQHYTNAPNHVIAQTLLKLSLPLITGGGIWVAASFILIFVLNVRSVMLAYFLSFIMVYRDVFLKKRVLKKLLIFGFPLIVVVAIQADWLEAYNRIVFKDRMVGGSESLVNSASSGRIEIYYMYIQFIIANFSVKEWLIGYGPVWLAPGGPALGPHNDVLTFIISFGLIGSLGAALCYIYFFTKLPSGKARYIFGLCFLVLFLTNGVATHQSNILFVLLYIFYLPRWKYDDVDGHEKGCAQPVNQ